MYNSENILLIVLISLCIIAGIILSDLKAVTTFTIQDLVPINYPNNGAIESERFKGIVNINMIIGHIYISYIISRVTNISGENLALIPIGSLILPLGYFIILKNVFVNLRQYYKIILLSFPLALTLYSGLIEIYSWFKYSLTIFLFILLFLLLIKRNLIFHLKEIIILSVILFIGLSLIHYSLAFVALVLIFILLLKHILFNTIKFSNLGMLNYLFIIFVLIFTISNIDTIIQYYTTPSFKLAGLDKLLNRGLAYLGFDVKYDELESTPYYINPIINILRVIYIATPIFIILFYSISFFINKILKRNSSIKIDIIWLALIIASLTRSVLYINIGTTSLVDTTDLIFLPLFALIILYKNTKMKYVLLYSIIIMGISISSFILTLDSIDYRNRYTSINLYTNWFLNHEPVKLYDQYNISASIYKGDHKDIALHILLISKYGFIPKHSYFDTYSYKTLLEPSEYTPLFTDVFLHKDNKPIIGVEVWNFYKPINSFLEKINNNYRFNKIYDDSITFHLKIT
jgi:hypothetical protein